MVNMKDCGLISYLMQILLLGVDDQLWSDRFRLVVVARPHFRSSPDLSTNRRKQNEVRFQQQRSKATTTKKSAAAAIKTCREEIPPIRNKLVVTVVCAELLLLLLPINIQQ